MKTKTVFFCEKVKIWPVLHKIGCDNNDKILRSEKRVWHVRKVKLENMKNNYKQLTTSPTTRGHHLSSSFKRSASHALRSSFRLPVKNKRMTSSQFHALNLDQLPIFVPPKALKLLQIDLPPLNNVDNLIKSTMNVNGEPIKIATIRKKSVWANASTSKCV